jgi:hypothetical protein
MSTSSQSEPFWTAVYLESYTDPAMTDETRDGTARTREDPAAREELRAIFAASKAQRAILRERFDAALRRLERLSEGARR